TDDGRFGASCDGFLSDGRFCEIKCPTPRVHVEYLLAGVLPPDYLCQCHGEAIVTGKQGVFVSYCIGLPELLVPITPDDFTDELRVCLEMFYQRFQTALAKIKGM